MQPNPIHIIAEAGTNHNGDLDTALMLVDLAKRAKAQSVKFQIINPEGLYLPVLFENGTCRPNPIIEQRRRYMLSNGDYRKIAAYAKNLGMEFSASVFDEEGIELLLACNPSYLKIASCDLNNLYFLRKAAEKAGERNIPIILSTGFSTLKEIEKSVAEIIFTGFKDIILLHCVSIYPAVLAQMNLGFIDVLKHVFGLPIGLSDHTSSSIAAAIAMSKGATYFEKHVTLDKSQNGFDHSYALEQLEFIQYVQDLNDTYKALQTKNQKLSNEELKVKQRARRALYAARKLKAGEAISEQDILILRPEADMAADEVDFLIGKRCKADTMQYQPFTKDMIAE
jgi:N,N'-diacetyllegionaminate synthase